MVGADLAISIARDSSVEEFVYDSSGKLQQVVESGGDVWTVSWNPAYVTLSLRQPDYAEYITSRFDCAGDLIRRDRSRQGQYLPEEKEWYAWDKWTRMVENCPSLSWPRPQAACDRMSYDDVTRTEVSRESTDSGYHSYAKTNFSFDSTGTLVSEQTERGCSAGSRWSADKNVSQLVYQTYRSSQGPFFVLGELSDRGSSYLSTMYQQRFDDEGRIIFRRQEERMKDGDLLSWVETEYRYTCNE